MKEVKGKKNQDKAVKEEKTLTHIIWTDFPNSVKPGL